MPRMDEKRSAPRITTVVPVNCRVIGHASHALPSLRKPAERVPEFPAKTINLSRNGMLIHCDTDLFPNATMEISLNAPNDGHPVKITAEVAWSRRNSIDLFGHYSAGLRIKKIGEKDMAILSEFFRIS